MLWPLWRRLVIVASVFTVGAVGDHLSVLSVLYVLQFIGFKCRCWIAAHWLMIWENVCWSEDGLIVCVCVWMTDGPQDCCQHPQGQRILRDYPPPANTHKHTHTLRESPPMFWRPPYLQRPEMDPKRSPPPPNTLGQSRRLIRSSLDAVCQLVELWPRKPNGVWSQWGGNTNQVGYHAKKLQSFRCSEVQFLTFVPWNIRRLRWWKSADDARSL